MDVAAELHHMRDEQVKKVFMWKGKSEKGKDSFCKLGVNKTNDFRGQVT